MRVCLIRVLSLGCTTTPLNVNWGRYVPLGKLYWGLKIADVFMSGQSSSALGMAQLLIEDRANIVRISPSVGRRFDLDKVSELPSLKGLGASEARKAMPQLRRLFFDCGVVKDDFVPFHKE